MNKRILSPQLLKLVQAAGPGYSQANPEWVKKFAELIVRECSNMCYKASQESFRLNEVKAGAMGMALKVLMEEHFGVVE